MLHIVGMTFGPNQYFVRQIWRECFSILSKYLYDEIPIDFLWDFFEF